MKIRKNRYWAFVFYPNEPYSFDEVIAKLTDTHIKTVISPFHDRDINPDGEPKKPHYHVMVCWDGPTTFQNASEVLCNLNLPANGHVENVGSARGMYRYFTHKDNPEKAQYDEHDMTCLNGFNEAELLSETDRNNLALEISRMIRQLGFTNFADLDFYLQDEGLIAHWNVFQSKTGYFKELLKGQYLKKQIALQAGEGRSSGGSGSANPKK